MDKKHVLVVVDYQNDFVTGVLGFPNATAIEGGISDRIEACWKNGGTVIFTYDTHESDYMDTVEGKNLPVPHCIENTDGWNLYGEVKKWHDYGKSNNLPMTDICKPTFGSLGLISALNDIMDEVRDETKIEIEFAGVVSNICVISNAIIAKSTMPEANIWVNRSICASNDNEMEQKAFDILENLHIKVR